MEMGILTSLLGYCPLSFMVSVFYPFYLSNYRYTIQESLINIDDRTPNIIQNRRGCIIFFIFLSLLLLVFGGLVINII